MHNNPPRPKTVEIWFGPNPPDVSKFASVPNSKSVAEIVAMVAIAPTEMIGERAIHIRPLISSRERINCRNNTVAAASPIGPSSTKARRSREVPVDSAAKVIAIAGTSERRKSAGTPMRLGRLTKRSRATRLIPITRYFAPSHGACAAAPLQRASHIEPYTMKATTSDTRRAVSAITSPPSSTPHSKAVAMPPMECTTMPSPAERPSQSSGRRSTAVSTGSWTLEIDSPRWMVATSPLSRNLSPQPERLDSKSWRSPAGPSNLDPSSTASGALRAPQFGDRLG